MTNQNRFCSIECAKLAAIGEVLRKICEPTEAKDWNDLLIQIDVAEAWNYQGQADQTE